MTQITPATYFFNREQIHFVPDISYNVPSIGEKVIIKDRTFEVKERKMMGLERGKRMWFIDLKDSACSK